MVRFDTLGTTFIPRIFKAKDWANLFGNFEDPMEELVREFFSNARYIGVELKCWVIGKEFSINPNYIAKVLRITRPEDVASPLMMIELLRFKTFYKFLGLIMKSPIKAYL